MGVREIGYEWTCDWCGHKTMHDDGAELPPEWDQASDSLHCLEHGVFCSADCLVNYEDADKCIYGLQKEIARCFMRHFKGQQTVPELPQIRALIGHYNSETCKEKILEPMDER